MPSSKSEETSHQVVPFPSARALIRDIGSLAKNRNTIRGLLEYDVTLPRRLIRQHQAQSGERLSFTAYLAACLGRAVARNKYLHAYRDWRNRLVLFDDVDVSMMVEIEQDGKKIPIGHIVRAANRKTVQAIHAEIRAAQEKPLQDQEANQMYLFRVLPGFLRRLLLRLVDRSPALVKRYKGTVILSAVGMFGRGGGWGLSLPSHTLGVTVGGIEQKPGIVDGRFEAREYLNVTLDFDHDIVDGAPAARFAQRLRELVECGYGLPNGQPS